MRNGKQCRERWHNHLDPTIIKNPWKSEEESLLFAKQAILGNKWAEIARFLPGRTDNDIKNHYYSTMRKQMRKQKEFAQKQGNFFDIGHEEIYEELPVTKLGSLSTNFTDDIDLGDLENIEALNLSPIRDIDYGSLGNFAAHFDYQPASPRIPEESKRAKF